MKKIFSLAMLCALVFAFSSASEGVEVLSNDMYRIENIVIKFRAPKGWMMKEGSVPSIHLNFRPDLDDSSLASLGIVACSAPFAAGFDVEKLLNTTDSDSSIISKEIISFAGTKAFVSISQSSGLKTKTMQFLKDDNMFTITFVADIKDFDVLLPKVDGSLKSFRIVMSELTEGQSLDIVPSKTMMPEAPILNQMPLPLVAEPYQEKGQINSMVSICLKSGTTIKGTVLERLNNRLKVDFHGVPISVYFSDINTIDEITPATN